MAFMHGKVNENGAKCKIKRQFYPKGIGINSARFEKIERRALKKRATLL